MILRKVLQLYQATGPSVGTVCTVELEHAVGTFIHADGVLHCLILLHGRFCELLAEDERILNRMFIGCFDKLPIIEKEFTLSLDNDTQNETICDMSRKK